MSIAGYKQVGGTQFWPAMTAYNGGTMRVWASEINLPNSHLWNAFADALAATPTDQIWFQGCEGVGDDPANGHADALAVIAEIRERIPGATIYFSAINDYVAPHVCDSIGPSAPANVRVLRDQLVAEGHVLLGPDMGSLISSYQTPSAGATLANDQTLPDGCHPNKAGKAYVGQRLLGFFSAPPAPTLTTTPSDPSGSSVVFEFTDAQSSATFTCAIDGGPAQACASPFAVSGLVDGDHVFEVRAVTAVASLPASFAWTVDASSPPPAPIITVTPSDPSGSSVTFEFTDQQSGVTFTCSVDGGAASSCVSPFAISGLVDGGHVFEVRAVDQQANVSAPATFAWTVDASAPPPPPPAPTFTATPSNPSGSSVTFEFTDAQAGVTFTCALDGATASACASPFAISGLGGGSHVLDVRALDGTQQSSPPATFGWTVDAIAPTVTMVLPAADTLLGSTAVSASWTGSDNTGVVRYDVWQRIGTAGTPVLVQSSTATSYAITGSTATTYCFQVFAFDAVGNSASGEERCAAVPFDDGNPAVSYAGTVTHVAATGAFLGTRTHLTGTGQQATLTFTGRKFGVLALLDPSSGRMTVLVDGAVVATVDLYAKRAQAQTVSIRTVTTGTHTVTLAWTGTKSAASSGTTIKIDGIAVIAS
jgi:hypothetical protein